MTSESLLKAIGAADDAVLLRCERPARRPYVYIAVAACAALAITIGLLAPRFVPNTPSLPAENSTTATHSSVTSPTHAHGKPSNHMAVQTISLARSFADGKYSYSVYSGTFTFNAGKGSALYEHEGCSGVSYSAVDSLLFCPTHALKESLKENPDIDTTNITVKAFSPSLGKILFISDKNTYFYDLGTGELKHIHVDLYHTSTYMQQQIENDSPYTLISGDHWWLVRMDTEEVVPLAKAGKDNTYQPSTDSYAALSRGQKYAYYTLDKGGANVIYAPARNTVFLNLETRETVRISGEVCDGTPDDRYFTVMTDSGLQVFDTALGKVVPFEGSGIPEQYRYAIHTSNVGSYFSKKLEVIDLLTKETVTVLHTYAGASAASDDRKTIYYYVRGQAEMNAYDVLTSAFSKTEVEDTFVQITEGEALRGYEINFHLRHDPTRDILLLSYYPSSKRRDVADENGIVKEKSPYDSLMALKDSGKLTSIASLESVLIWHHGFPDKLTVYEGDGFAYVVINPLYVQYKQGGEWLSRDDGNLYVLYEDYRTNSFYIIEHNQKAIGAYFTVTDGPLILPSDAQERTRKCISHFEVRFSVKAAEMDYNDFMTDGNLTF